MRHALAALLAACLGVPEPLHAEIRVDRAFDQGLHSAANPYDASLWLATGDSRLLHLSRDGSLAASVVLPAPAAALAVDLDETLWIASGTRLLHFDRRGNWMEEREPGIGPDEAITGLAIDSLRSHLWMATTKRIVRLPVDSTAAGAPADVMRGDAEGIAIEPRSGTALAIVDRSLVTLDERGARRARHHPVTEFEEPLEVVYDATDALFVVMTRSSLLRVSIDGSVVERSQPSGDETFTATPFRIEPMLTLVRPPPGAVVTDPYAETILVAGALCNGEPCDLPDGYLRGLQVEAFANGAAFGEPLVDPVDGRIGFSSHAALRPGSNRVDARVKDRFGHGAALEDARLWLLDSPLDRAADPVREHSASIVTERNLKAANKAPVVSLTGPPGGATFTAGTDITLTATASDPDGTITKVDFYRGGSTLLGSTVAAPYRYVWRNAPAGSHALTAKAYDNRNATATSTPVPIVVVDNQLPAVVVTAPAAESFIPAGSSVTVTASATDPDGTIAAVEFMDGATSIGTATTPPYAVLWSDVAAGTHSIVARARDDRGGLTNSAPVDVLVGEPPAVVVVAPTACASFDGPLDVTLAADVQGKTGRIASVEFFDNGVPVGSSAAPPWRTTLANAAVGTHSIVAKATDDRGLVASSRGATFSVRGANQPPTVALVAPAEGTRFPAGSRIDIAASAADTDGSVTAVEFRIGGTTGTLIGRAVRAPFVVTWTGMPSGSYALIAIAYDDRGATTTSSPVHITVDANALPSVVLTAPLPQATFAAPATIGLAASASDADGTIAKVEFYAGPMLIASASKSPFAATWSDVAAGNYTITAKAIDNLGGGTTSAPVAVSVADNAAPTITLTEPGAGSQYFAPATISLSADAADADGSVSRVDYYANGALVGSSSAPPYRFVWDRVAAGSYSLTAKAIDDRAASSTSASVAITVGSGPAIAIASSLEGATIDDDRITVRGFVSAPTNAAVAVNGIVTHIDDHGGFQANDVPLAAGANVVTAVVTTQDGQASSHSVTMNSTGPGLFVVDASPTEGLDALQVTFTIENPRATPFKEIRLDLDNDGLPNLVARSADFVDGRLVLTATYPAGTWLAVIGVYDDQDRAIYTTSKSIVVLSPSRLANTLRAVYDGMLARLRAGNVEAALTAFTGTAYDKYNAIFTRLRPSLPSIVDQLGELREVNFNGDLAEFSVVRNSAGGPERFLLYLIRSEDGIWRIDGM